MRLVKKAKNRVRLSVLALQTKNMLFYLLLGIAISITAVYLFTLNHIAFRGYVLQKEAETGLELLEEISYIETKIARIQTRETLEKAINYYPLVPRERERFIRIEPNFTARESGINHILQ